MTSIHYHAGSAVKLADGVYQDGATFWRERDDVELGDYLLAHYPDLVRHDYDIEGAGRARHAFARDYPEYAHVVVSDA